MSPELEKAVDSLRAELARLNQRASEVQKLINQMLAMDGQPPEFPDADAGTVMTGSMKIEPTTFLGMKLENAARMFLKMRGKAATAQEIRDALESGGYKFEWKPNRVVPNLGITLGQKKADFVSFDTVAGKMYGLWEQYPDKKRERDRPKQNSVKSESEEATKVDNTTETPKQ